HASAWPARARFQSCIPPSALEASTQLPSGLIETPRTGLVLAPNTIPSPSGTVACKSHSHTEFSCAVRPVLAVTSPRPTRLHETGTTLPACPLSVSAHAPGCDSSLAGRLQSRTVVSTPPETSHRPSGVIASWVTG